MANQPFSSDEPDNVLPVVQSDASDGSQLPARDNDQPIPQNRALVPLPEEASDADLIEKEWVLKAKMIVEHTASDPFKMQEELSKVKADYIKKRYNKDLGSNGA